MFELTRLCNVMVPLNPKNQDEWRCWGQKIWVTTVITPKIWRKKVGSLWVYAVYVKNPPESLSNFSRTGELFNFGGLEVVWLNQPICKICASQIGNHFFQGFGVNIKKRFELPPRQLSIKSPWLTDLLLRKLTNRRWEMLVGRRSFPVEIPNWHGSQPTLLFWGIFSPEKLSTENPPRSFYVWKEHEHSMNDAWTWHACVMGKL